MRKALHEKHATDGRFELAILRQPEEKRLELLELARVFQWLVVRPDGPLDWFGASQGFVGYGKQASLTMPLFLL